MFPKTVLMLALLIAVPSTIVLAAAPFKEGKWEMSMTTQVQGDSEQAQDMKQAMEEMKNMPPEARAMMEKMQGGMGMKMSAAPGGGMTTTVTQCLTGEHPIPKSREQAAHNCQEQHDIRGNTIHFKVSCKERGSETHSTGQMTYHGDTMKGETRTRHLQGKEEMETVVQLSGRYLGPCEAKK